MPLSPALLPLLAPLALVGVALAARSAPGLRPRGLIRLSRAASLAALAVALGTALAVAVHGPVTSPLIGVEGAGLSLRLDVVSVTLFLLVAFIGWVVTRFSMTYLDGDARQGAFVGRLALTLAAVMLLVTAGNLWQLVGAWIATSLALHRLLVFYPDRRAAVTAARKKAITARLGDACLIAAAVLLARAYGTTDIAALLAAAEPGGAALPAVLIAVAALLKSAQFPTHGWLTEVMDTPTPVSALLHAGIVNAGGFLVIRFADVMLAAPGALHLLAILGGFTALFGAVVMLTQTSVKVSLAWSTVAQMGFMLLQCGLGAFALALLHIVAHSLYKAHAFLASGSAVDLARITRAAGVAPPPAPAARAGALVLALGLYGGLGLGLGLGPDSPAVLVLGAILVLGLTHYVAQALRGGGDPRLLARVGVSAAGVSLVYFALQAGTGALTAGTLPPPPAPAPLDIAIMGLAVVSFAGVTLFQIGGLAHRTGPAWEAARIHLANGLYVNLLFDRLIGAWRAPGART